MIAILLMYGIYQRADFPSKTSTCGDQNISNNLFKCIDVVPGKTLKTQFLSAMSCIIMSFRTLIILHTIFLSEIMFSPKLCIQQYSKLATHCNTIRCVSKEIIDVKRIGATSI